MVNPGDKAAAEALKHIGQRYIWGTSGPTTFDCSGLTSYVWRVGAGVTFSTGSQAQWGLGTAVSTANLRPGDILCYDTDDNGYQDCSHVGIYISPGKMVNALNESAGVVASDPFSAYFKPRYLGARRMATYTDAAASAETTLPVTGSTPWRTATGATTSASAVTEFRTVGGSSPLIPVADALVSAADDLGRLMLAISYMEQKHSTYPSVAQSDQFANSHNFLSLSSGYANGAHTWFSYPTFAACVADWRTRLLSIAPTAPYRNSVTIYDLIAIYAPPIENDTQHYVDIVCQIINRNVRATTVPTTTLTQSSLAIIEPNSLNLGSAYTNQPVTSTSAQRTLMTAYAAATVNRIFAAAGVSLPVTTYNPSSLTIPISNSTTQAPEYLDAAGLASQMEAIGASAQAARVILVPGGSWSTYWNGFMNFAGKTSIVYDNNQFAVGAFGTVGATLCHEWLHSIEQRLIDAGYRVGYGLDIPAVHDGSTDAGRHRAQYPENVTDRDEWKYLIDMMTANVPRPGRTDGSTYGITPEMWRKIFPSVSLPTAPATGLKFGAVSLPSVSVRDISGSLNTAWDNLGQRKAMFVVLHRMYGTLLGTDSYFRNEARFSARTDYGVDNYNGAIYRWTDPLGTMSPWASGPWTSPPGDGIALVAKYGISAINRDGVSIEIAGSGNDPVTAGTWTNIAQLIAYWADQNKIPWDQWPISPKTGLTFVYWHREFNGGKGPGNSVWCPGAVVENYTAKLIEDVRAILKAAQGTASTPATPNLPPVGPPTTQPTTQPLPPGVTLQQLKNWFGTVTLTTEGAENAVSTFSYDPNGPVSSVWVARGTATGKWPTLKAVTPVTDQWATVSSVVSVGRDESLVFTFEDGLKIVTSGTTATAIEPPVDGGA